MDVPGSSNQRDHLRRSTSTPPSSPEMKSQMEKIRSPRVDSKSARLEESFSNAEIEMSSIYRAMEQCLAEERSRGKAPEKCIEDKIDLNTPITECSKIVGQYKTLGKEDQGGMQVAKCLRKTIQELEEEITKTSKKRKALEEELRAVEESRRR